MHHADVKCGDYIYFTWRQVKGEIKKMVIESTE